MIRSPMTVAAVARSGKGGVRTVVSTNHYTTDFPIGGQRCCPFPYSSLFVTNAYDDVICGQRKCVVEVRCSEGTEREQLH